jgi:GT2 family glycosyltransferase
VAQARGEILAFTDSDCQPEPEWLEQGVQALSRCDFVGGQMRVLVDDPDAVTATEAFELVFAFDNETYVFQKGFTVTANLFCRREMFDRVGAFGVGLSEDVDWCHRATRAEFKIGYEPAAVVGHPARRTWAELEKKWRRTNREAYLLHSSSPQGFVKYVARSAATPLSAFVHTPRVLFSNRLKTNRQRIQALQALYRLRFWRFANSMALVLGKGRH